MMGWGWNGGWNGGAGWGVASSVLSIVFLAAVAVGVILLIRALATSPAWRSDRWRSGPPAVYGDREMSSALQILEERYARGEIDREEFLERKRHLQS